MALGGSTNAVIHLIALARRSGVPLNLARFDEISRRVPVLANIRPSGEYLMEDFYYAGGLRGLLSRLEGMLHLDRATVGGSAAGETLTSVYDNEVIKPLDEPLQQEG
jgi:dihydroxyacid dehydratase/phosphogluconate dehydratase